MKIIISENATELGIVAAKKVSDILIESVNRNGNARILVSTGASQFEFFEAMLEIKNIPWEKIEVFHLDEYLGLSSEHKASFRKYLHERFISKVNPLIFHEVSGEGDIKLNIKKLTVELEKRPIDIGVIGIGENAHIAFNDPPADFDTKESYIIVELDEKCKKQQVNEGWFPTISDVPTQAITMSVYRILQCKNIVSVVPHKVKAKAVKNTLEANKPTNIIPASVLKEHKNWTLYLDKESSSLIQSDFLQ